MPISTHHLILREPKLEDFDRYWLMINDPVAKKFTGGVTKLKYEERLKLFTSDLANITEPVIEFSVIEKSSGSYLGYCGFLQTDKACEGELIFGYCRDSWGKGYGYEAAKAVCEYGFKVLTYTHITALVSKNNIATLKILNKLGMVPFGQIEHPITGLTEIYRLTKTNYFNKQ
jgi:RimJ/RimL family protein N-acetyltransferase